ncbi:DUF6265 family protein [Pedobacter immunditicola]|uniref:DUF6265 family protein n=1 Tax=Pedobacter immunditicola TaxID=3133440 RepID=UPI003096BCD2
MKLTLSIVITFLLTALNAYQPGTFKQLYPLIGGTWEMQTKTGKICESWIKVNKSELASKAYRINGKDTIPEENARLVLNGNAIYFTPIVENQNAGEAVQFKLISADNRKFTFSNPAHDFPQTIVYHFTGKDQLHAWIEGKNKGKEQKIDFYYNRVR